MKKKVHRERRYESSTHGAMCGGSARTMTKGSASDRKRAASTMARKSYPHCKARRKAMDKAVGKAKSRKN